MKKCINLIYLVLISSSLNAMIFKAPDVTKWQEICKDPQEKQQLMTVYQEFCQKRIKDNIAWTTGSFVPFIFKSVRNNYHVLVGLFAIRQTYLLGRNTYRNQLATKEDLFYLNHDVLEQLGNPDVWNSKSTFGIVYYDYGNWSVKKTFGYARTLVRHTDRLSVNNVDGIETALSGNYKTSDYWSETYLEMKKKVELIIKDIKDKLE